MVIITRQTTFYFLFSKKVFFSKKIRLGVFSEDNLHEMTKPIFWKKKKIRKNINKSEAEFAQSGKGTP